MRTGWVGDAAAGIFGMQTTATHALERQVALESAAHELAQRIELSDVASSRIQQQRRQLMDADTVRQLTPNALACELDALEARRSDDARGVPDNARCAGAAPGCTRRYAAALGGQECTG